MILQGLLHSLWSNRSQLKVSRVWSMRCTTFSRRRTWTADMHPVGKYTHKAGTLTFSRVHRGWKPAAPLTCQVTMANLLPLLFLKNICLFYFFIWVLVAACGIFSCGMQTLSCGTWDLVTVPWPRTELRPLHWLCGALATGPPGKSLLPVLSFCFLRL